MEKIGYTTFKIEKQDGKYFYVDNQDHLTSYQEKQMSFQPDFILEYAHYLGEYYNKKGFTEFKIVDGETSDSFYVLNENFLTEFQERQMSFQPDFILEYAHYLGEYYNNNGFNNVEVYAESYVTLNGRTSKRFIDPNVDLMKEKRGFSNKKWIIELKDEIKGF